MAKSGRTTPASQKKAAGQSVSTAAKSPSGATRAPKSASRAVMVVKNPISIFARYARPAKVIIAGAGIGGLTLALMLHRRGISSTIYEQASEVREIGVGINTLPHAIRELADLGLLPAL